MQFPMHTWALALANILLPISIIVFATGFFPYKPLLPGLATFPETGNINAPPPVFDKIIFMVVDALRSDFVFDHGSGFLFTQSLIQSGSALPFTAYAGSPTVTMPRLKAITTGSVPSFLDVILNIAESSSVSTLSNQDTWLAQLKARGGRLVMYGDDTWLNLFPDMFDRADGTTSFFVSDFVEVDNNVTRHIPFELSNSDWTALIMHYLGLDHIGHKAGPNSPYMKGKQNEMDSIVKQIYTAMEENEHLQSTLFVLCGDHGMNEAGNHGGSSAGETSPALVFISPRFQGRSYPKESPIEASQPFQYYRTVEQSDITPTIAGLLGLPIPLNNLGVFIPELLMMWDEDPLRVSILLENAKQLLRVLEATYPDQLFDPSLRPVGCGADTMTELEKIHCAWAEISSVTNRLWEDASEIEPILLHFLKSAQKTMSFTASNYNVSRLYLGIIISSTATLLSFLSTYRQFSRQNCSGAYFTFCGLIFTCMMFASSYVEEEHQFWYWALSGWTLYLHTKSNALPGQLTSLPIENKTICLAIGALLYKFGAIGLIIMQRFMRRWNQTGQKFAAEPDISRNFFPFHVNMLWTLIIITYADSCRHLIYYLPSKLIFKLAAIITTCIALLFKLAFVALDSPELLYDCYLARQLMDKIQYFSPLWLARFVFCSIGLLTIVSFQKKTQQENLSNRILHEALNLFLLTQSRATNIPLFLLFRLQLSILCAMDLTGVETSITLLLYQYMTFFAFGGSNAISSVDLSSAYNGIGSYAASLVGLLTFVGNWAGPIWWSSAFWLLLAAQAPNKMKAHIAVSTCYAAVALLSVMAACTLLRTHLFIWTVFSPKFLYSMAWTLGSHIGVNLLFYSGWRFF